MNLAINRYDYFQSINFNIEVTEDSHGIIKINDYSGLSDMTYLNSLEENILEFLPTKFRRMGHPKL